MQQLPSNGLMVSLLGDLELVDRLIEPFKEVAIAAINGDRSIVISGENKAIESIIKELKKDGIKYKELNTSHAFHSPLMQPMLDEFCLVANEINYSLPELDIVSNVTGDIISTAIATAEYWCKQIINPVLFADSIRVLDDAGYRIFLECGSKPILLGMGRFCLEESFTHRGATPQNLASDPAEFLIRKGTREQSALGSAASRDAEENYLWVSSLKEGEGNWQTLLSGLASLYKSGVEIDWDSFYGGGSYRRVVLPTYPFEKKSYWLNVEPISISRGNNFKINSLLGNKLNIARTKNIVFENNINCNQPGFLKDHQIFDTTIMPAAGYVEMVLSAARKILKCSRFILSDISLQQPLLITESKTIIQLVLTSENNNYGFEIVSLSDDSSWITHATGSIKKKEKLTTTENNLLTKFKKRCKQEINRDRYYHELAQRGLKYGVTCQAITQLWSGKNTALAKIKLPSKLLPVTDNYQLHPVILDGCLQTIGATFLNGEADTYLPASLEELSFDQQIVDGTQDYWGYVELAVDNDNYLANICLLDNQGRVIAKIYKLLLKKANQKLLTRKAENNYDDWLYEIKWQKELLSLDSNLLIKPELIKKRVAKYLKKPEDLLNYKQLVPELESLSVAYIFQAFDNIGLQLRLGDSFTVEELINKYNIVPKQQKLFTRLLEILATEDILTKSNGNWDVVHPVGNDYVRAVREQLGELQNHPEIKAELDLLTKCASQLDRILQGIDPLNILFPQGDLSALTNLYQNSPQANYFNNLVKNTVLEAIKNKSQTRQLKILEIGAGTGSTTAYLLPELQDKNIEYTFSDISALFLTKAQEKFVNYDFVNYKILDIEKEQELQDYDLIIAVNVIHATENLAVTIKNIHQLLVPQGIFLLVEGTQPLYWVDLIFGLTDG